MSSEQYQQGIAVTNAKVRRLQDDIRCLQGFTGVDFIPGNVKVWKRKFACALIEMYGFYALMPPFSRELLQYMTVFVYLAFDISLYSFNCPLFIIATVWCGHI